MGIKFKEESFKKTSLHSTKQKQISLQLKSQATANSDAYQ
jgi:hypothetical protein